jgi:hypothetical protein
MSDTPSVWDSGHWGPCCFCAKTIEPNAIDPCRIVVTTRADKWQVWFCHAACFKARLTHPPDAPGFLAPAHF